MRLNWKKVFCNIATKSQVVTKFIIAKSRLHTESSTEADFTNANMYLFFSCQVKTLDRILRSHDKPVTFPTGHWTTHKGKPKQSTMRAAELCMDFLIDWRRIGLFRGAKNYDWGAGAWDPNYTPGLDWFFDHDFF